MTMKRPITLMSTLIFGVLIGSIRPMAFAHPDADCPQVECPPCPDYSMEYPAPILIEDNHPLQVEAEDAEAIKKALEAIEKAEKAEGQVQQVQQPVLPLEPAFAED